MFEVNDLRPSLFDYAMNEYSYSVAILKRIANAYQYIYECIPANRPPKRKCRDEVLIFSLIKALGDDPHNGSYPVTHREISELLRRTNDITLPDSLVEYKADFDTALNELGRGKWCGLQSHDFSDYKDFGQYQRAIIASILDIGDYKLKALGLPRSRQYRQEAFIEMARFLNGNRTNAR